VYVNGKMRPIEIIPGMEGPAGGGKENDGGGEFNDDFFFLQYWD
jgi:hypothetical protein